MLNILVASKNAVKQVRIKNNWSQILAGKPAYELHFIDAPSLCEAYRAGEQKIGADSGDINLYAHDDVFPMTPTFYDRLIKHFSDKEVDVVAAAASQKATDARWFTAGPPYVHGMVCHFQPASQVSTATGIQQSQACFNVANFGCYKRLMHNMQVADGFFIAARPGALRWDAKVYKDFHLYDLDATYDAYQRGLQIACAQDLNLLHLSEGGYAQPAWPVEAAKFLDKWKAFLPPQPYQGLPFQTAAGFFPDALGAVNYMELCVAQTEK